MVNIKFIGYDVATKKKVIRVISDVIDRVITETAYIDSWENNIGKCYLDKLQKPNMVTEVTITTSNEVEYKICFKGTAYVMSELGNTIDTIRG